MTLRLNGSASGYTELEAAPVAGNNKITLPASSGSSGQILKNSNGVLDWSQIRENADGSISLVAGTAAAPSLSFTGDSNTGIYSPGADQVAISTNGTQRLLIKDASQDTFRVSGVNAVVTADAIGSSYPGFRLASNGSILAGFDGDSGNSAILLTYGAQPLIFGTNSAERLRITSAGLVGIGTSSPSYALQVAETSAVVSAASYSTFFGQGTRADLILQATSSNNDQQRQVIRSNSDSLIFGTENAAVTTFTEKLRIDSSGRVGIGTSSPSYTLDVAGTNARLKNASGSVELVLSRNSNSAGASISLNTGDTNKWFFGLRGLVDDKFYFYNNVAGNTALTIDESSRLGIGTTSPTTTLDCRGVISTNDAIYCYNTARDGLGIWYNPGGAGVNQLTARVAGGDRLTIDSSGLVGIGTTSPSEKLTVDGSLAITWGSGRRAGMFYDNSIRQGLAFDDSNRQLKLFSTANDSGGTIAFYTRLAEGSSDTDYGTERARIDSSGRLLVGTSSSSAEAKFIVQGGNTGSGGGMNIQRSVTTASAGSTIGFINFTNSSNNVGATVIAEGDGTWSAGTSHPTRLAFSTTANGASSPTERLRITSAGLVGVGTSSPLTKLDVRSGVITAGSTSSPSGTEILRGYYSDTDGALAVIGTEYSSGGTVIGSAVKPSTSTSGAFLSSTTINITRGAYTIAGNTHKWYIGAVQTVAENSSVSTSEVMRIDSSGRLLVGTSTSTENVRYDQNFSFVKTGSNTFGGGSFVGYSGTSAEYAPLIDFKRSRGTTDGSMTVVASGDRLGGIAFLGADGNSFEEAANIRCYVDGAPGDGDMPGRLVFSTTADGASSPTERVRITSTGLVGIGTTDPGYLLDCQKAGTQFIRSRTNDTGAGNNAGGFIGEYLGGGGGTNTQVALAAVNGNAYLSTLTNAPLLLGVNSVEKARIDTSGRLLVGTSSASGTNTLFESSSTTANAANVALVKQNSGTADQAGQQLHFYNFGPAGTARAADTEVGSMRFYGSQPTSGAAQEMARITCAADLIQTGLNTSGRLVFSTTPDGASSPTERMRIINDGGIYIGKTSGAMATKGIAFEPYATTRVTTDSTGVDQVCLYLNRQSSDGVLLKFFQENTEEGNISVSGTTVSYNGAHLSRWSQLPSGAERTEILRGTVLSNIDEMCEWGEEDNEQLNRMKVSDVEGDKNVSGVFQAWDDDDNTYTNDFYCAMTGDFIIRIGAGVTVERGDLLMSAGDGTAKPQDDDIIRSKTIAKVTSTNVSCTYGDGSYCVPCVLMAC